MRLICGSREPQDHSLRSPGGGATPPGVEMDELDNKIKNMRMEERLKSKKFEMRITNYAVVISHCLSGRTWSHKA